MKVTIEQYIAANNPRDAQYILAKYGLPQASSEADLVKKLYAVFAKHKQEVAKDFAQIDTPYKALLDAFSPTQLIVSNADGSEVKSNCSGADGAGCKCGGSCGCGGTDDKRMPLPSNFALRHGIDGPAPEVKDKDAVTKQIIIGGLALVLGITLVSVIKG